MNSTGAAPFNGALIGAPTIVRASRYSMAAVLAGEKTSALHFVIIAELVLASVVLLSTEVVLYTSWPTRICSRNNRKTAVHSFLRDE